MKISTGIMALILLTGFVNEGAVGQPNLQEQEDPSEGESKTFTPPAIEADFMEKEFLPYKAKGTASITGRAFVMTRSGEPRYGAGHRTYLIPVSSYTKEWFHKHVYTAHDICFGSIGNEKCNSDLVIPPDDRVTPYIRSARVDADGHFWFTKLPRGKYYLTCLVTWTGAGRFTGYVAYEIVELEDGEHARVVVSRG